MQSRQYRSANPAARTWRSEKLTESPTGQPDSRHCATCLQASVSTQAPSGTISPESSAMPRNSAGSICSPALVHRTSASTLATREVDSSTTGWYSMPRWPSSIASAGPGQLQPPDHISVHVRGKHLDAAAASVLRTGHGQIRVAKEMLSHVGVSESYADAGGDRQVQARYGERLGRDRARQPFGDVDDLLGPGRCLDQHGELVAAPPGDGVVSRHQPAQPAASLRQHQVPGTVADRVVDGGEAVQVDEDGAGLTEVSPDRQVGRSTGSYRILLPQQVLRPLLQVRPVRQAGQAVMEGEVGDLLAQCHLIADVARGHQQQVSPARLRVPGQGGLDVPPGAV